MFSSVGKRKFYVGYIVTFFIMSFFIFGNYIFQGKSFIRFSDGLNQYFYSLCYYARYLREIINNLWTEHSFVMPMWDMSIGLGSDILTTLHYYAIGDPLNLLAVFVKSEDMIYLFCALVVLRIFLAGLSFSYFCFSHGNKEQATLFGTLIYCFSGWCLLIGMKYATFINVMIYFPLILVGIDRIYRKERANLFIVMTALSALSNFYFFYMICVFMFIYAVFRYFQYGYTVQIKTIFNWFAIFVGYFVIALFISACVLLPNISVLISGKRMEVDYIVPLFYTISYYLSIPLSFTTFWNFGGSGYTPFMIPALLILFRKKNKRSLKVGFALLLLFLCIPFFGHALNGFSYVSNRWFWALTFFMCYIIVKGYPEFFLLSKRECLCMGIIGVSYALLWPLILGKWYMSLLLLFMCFILVVIISLYIKDERKPFWTIALYAAVFLCINVNSKNIYMDNTASEGIINNVSLDASDSLYLTAPAAAMKEKFEKKRDFRYDQLFSNTLISINTPMLHKVNGMQFYFSLADGAIEDFFDELYINAPCDFQYAGFDSRTILNSISAVKYCLNETNGTQPIPWGYHRGELSKDKKYLIYEQNNALPLAFTYDSYVSEVEWREKSVVQKQAVFLKSVVLKESTFEQKEPEYNEKELEYVISNLNGVTLLKDGQLKTTKNSSITLSFSGMQNSETYVILENFNFVGDDTSSDIRFLTKDYQKSIRFFTNRYDQYSGRHDFLCNMGYLENGLNELRIVFDKEGIYSFDKLSVVCQPTENFGEAIEVLKEDVMQNIEIDTNKISGNISLKKPKILFFSIPYSKGWTLLVDGKKQELKQANIMFMAAELEKGTHSIELRYRTPYLLLGSCLSILGILFLLGINRSLFTRKCSAKLFS